MANTLHRHWKFQEALEKQRTAANNGYEAGKDEARWKQMALIKTEVQDRDE